MIIESIHNTIAKRVISLKTKKERDKQKVFIAEGLRFIEEIPDDWEIEAYLISDDFDCSALKRQLNAKSFVFKKNVFNSLSDTQNPQGILAICKQKIYDKEHLLEDNNSFFLLVNEIQDPGNLGTLIRTADAAGVDKVILSCGTVDLYNSKVLRATMGSIFHLPIVHDIDMLDFMSKLSSKNILTVAAHLKGTITPYEVNMKDSIALMVGNEANGIPDSISDKAGILVKIPMLGRAESLNASMAAGILMYEAVRQRIN